MHRQKTIGLIGGMSWESSAEYYRIINRGVQTRLGGVHSARCLLWSFDFEEIKILQDTEKWDAAALLLTEAAKKLEQSGTDFLVLCTNTMHLLAENVEDAVNIPLLHIADATAVKIQSAGIKLVGLLGTASTMEREFYKGRLAQKFDLDVLVPEEKERALVHCVIYEELVKGVIREESRAVYRQVIANLVKRGAQAVILGCTEIMLLVRPEDSSVPLFDTTTIHAEAAVSMALAP